MIAFSEISKNFALPKKSEIVGENVIWKRNENLNGHGAPETSIKCAESQSEMQTTPSGSPWGPRDVTDATDTMVPATVPVPGLRARRHVSPGNCERRSLCWGETKFANIFQGFCWELTFNVKVTVPRHFLELFSAKFQKDGGQEKSLKWTLWSGITCAEVSRTTKIVSTGMFDAFNQKNWSKLLQNLTLCSPPERSEEENSSTYVAH